MDKKKLIIICPEYFSLENAVASYTKKLISRLLESYKISLITDGHRGDKSKVNGDLTVYPVVEGWKGDGLWRIGHLIDQIGCDKVLFQYVPFMYERKGGINFQLPALMLYLRLIKRVDVELMCHELHYPLQFNPKAMIMYFSHLIMLFFGGIAAQRIFCSTGYFTSFTRKLFAGMKKNIFHLPVFSNVPRISYTREEQEQLRQELGLSNYMVVGLFGKFHPSKNYPLVLQAFDELPEDVRSKIKILSIGPTMKEIEQYIPADIFNKVRDMIVAVGYISDNELSKYLEIMDLFVGYFVDGISTRRGSLLTALQHGKRVVSTYTDKTDKIFFSSPGVALFATDEHSFKEALKGYLINLDVKEKIEALRIEEFYLHNFSSRVVAANYLKISEE